MRVLCIALASSVAVALSAFPLPADTVAWIGLESDPGGRSITDRLSGEIVGIRADSGGIPGLSGDVAMLTDGVDGEPLENLQSLDLTGPGFGNINVGHTGFAFPFHAVDPEGRGPAFGGIAGDITLEWVMKSQDQGHSAIFWTNGDDNFDQNRYNVFWNASFTGADGSDRFVESDFRAPDGGGPFQIGSEGHNSGAAYPVDEWVHVAITRTAIAGDNAYRYEWYKNGQKIESQTREQSGPLPTSTSWLIGGRSGAPSWRGLIDEIRVSDEILAPDDFLTVVQPSCIEDGEEFEDTEIVDLIPTVEGCRILVSVNVVTGGVDGVTVDLVLGGPEEATATATIPDGLGGGLVEHAFSVKTPGEYTVTAMARDRDPLVNPETGDPCPQSELATASETFDVDGPCGPDFTPRYLRFEEAEGDALIDSNTGESIGQLMDGAIISDDVPLTNPPLDGNATSADFTLGGFGRVSDPFIFHDPIGDATVEFYLKVPEPHAHAAIFWTSGGADDANRFNIFFNASFTGAEGSDTFVESDFAPADNPGARVQIGADGHNSGRPVPINGWTHIAVVRTDAGGGAFDWRWYYNGVENPNQQRSTVETLPDATEWLICGRQEGHSLNALVDEVRSSDVALGPGDFLPPAIQDCPAEGDLEFGDTSCSGLTVEFPGGEEGLAGLHTFTAQGSDGSGDEVLFTFTATEPGGRTVSVGPQPENSARLSLTLVDGAPTTWTVVVNTDDNPLCTDEAQNANCTREITVERPPVYLGGYYRFEEAEDLEVIDQNTEEVHGTIEQADPLLVWSPDVPEENPIDGSSWNPIPNTGDENTTSLDFTLETGGGGYARIHGIPFPLHEPSAGGAPGDATIELFMKVPAPHGHASWLWTNDDDQSDANRFNIFFNASFTGFEGSENWISGDWRNAVNPAVAWDAAAANHASFLELPLDQWHHIAITRTDLENSPDSCPGAVQGAEKGQCYAWNWYVDGELVEANANIISESVLPTASTWLICGRQGNASFSALVDEVRATGVARVPDPPPGMEKELGFLITDAIASGAPYVRGDSNADGSTNITDAVTILNFLFLGATAPTCLDAVDTNNDGTRNIADAVNLLNFLFQGTGNVPPPLMCGEDGIIGDPATCPSFAGCQ